MYGIAIVFALTTVSADGRTLETHGKFAELRACENAASVVEQNLHPLPAGQAIVCTRRAEVNVIAYSSKEPGQ